MRNLCCRYGLLLLLAVVSLSALAEEQTQPCAIFVRQGESIQAAIDAAPAGAVICLPAGEWLEHLTIGKSVVLQGEGAESTAIRGSAQRVPVIHVERPGQEAVVVTLAGLSVTGAENTEITPLSVGNDGIRLSGASLTRMRDCVILGCEGTGISLGDWAVCEISDCTASGNWYGISAADNAWLRIVSCTVSGNDTGMAFGGFATAMSVGCEVADNTSTGIEIGDSSTAIISDCSVTGTEDIGDGILITGSARATVAGCTMSGNKQAGLTVYDSAAVNVFDCEFSKNLTFSVLIDGDVTDVTIEACTMAGSQIGVVSDSDAGQIAVSHCTVSAQYIGVAIAGGESVAAAVRGCAISDAWVGVDVEGSAVAAIEDCTISANTQVGIAMAGSSRCVINRNVILDNGRYGVAAGLFSLESSSGLSSFAGSVSGAGNRIPGFGEPDGHAIDSVFPDDLDFLMTPEGGTRDSTRSP